MNKQRCHPRLIHSCCVYPVQAILPCASKQSHMQKQCIHPQMPQHKHKHSLSPRDIRSHIQSFVHAGTNSPSPPHSSNLHIKSPQRSMLSTARGSGRSTLIAGRQTAHSLSTAVAKRSPSQLSDQASADKAALLSAGFNDKQATRMLKYFGILFKLDNALQWLQIMQKLGVKQPFEAVSKRPDILEGRADRLQTRIQECVAWLSSSGLNNIQIAQVIGKWPRLLRVNPANMTAVAAWLSSELGWGPEKISEILMKSPILFGLSPSKNFTHKLCWFKSQGFTTTRLSRALFTTPALFHSTIERNKATLLALQALGLSQPEVATMVMQVPTLLNRNISGPIVQAKVRFLTEVMGKTTQDLAVCPVVLTRSLSNRIGPRWAFWARHFLGTPFTLSSLSATDIQFAISVASCPSVLAECVGRGVTPLQYLIEFTTEWQVGDGREWCHVEEEGANKESEDPAVEESEADHFHDNDSSADVAEAGSLCDDANSAADDIDCPS